MPEGALLSYAGGKPTSHTLQVSDLPSRELVPGDVIELRVGDKVPADCRVIKLKTATLRSEQASLTGESVAVLKCTDPGKDELCELQEKECMLFAGTAISNGNAICIVNDIGMGTEIGKIQAQLQSAAEEEDDSPLKKKLDEFGEMLAKVPVPAIIPLCMCQLMHHPGTDFVICCMFAAITWCTPSSPACIMQHRSMKRENALSYITLSESLSA